MADRYLNYQGRVTSLNEGQIFGNDATGWPYIVESIVYDETTGMSRIGLNVMSITERQAQAAAAAAQQAILERSNGEV